MLEEARSDMECMKCQIEQKSRMQQLADRSRGPPAVPANRGLLHVCLGCLSAEIARNWNSAMILRTHQSSPKSGSARTLREIRNSAKSQDGATQPLSAVRGAEFREPRELRGDSAWAWVWLGLRVWFGSVPTVKFYCSANSNVL